MAVLQGQEAGDVWEIGGAVKPHPIPIQRRGESANKLLFANEY